MLRISGRWFERLGFNSGEYVRIQCEDGKIIITPDKQKTEEAIAEKMFLEEEYAKLKIRFEKEKSEIHARFVAEQSAKYLSAKEGGMNK